MGMSLNKLTCYYCKGLFGTLTLPPAIVCSRYFLPQELHHQVWHWHDDDSIEQISGSEANSSQATQEIWRILRKTEVLLLVLQVPTMRSYPEPDKSNQQFSILLL